MRKSLIIVILLFVGLGFIFWALGGVKNKSGLVSPGLIGKLKNSPPPAGGPSPSPSPNISTYQFDSSTDLEKELDSVNPKVLDSDFR
jgi:hypothetical protein